MNANDIIEYGVGYNSTPYLLGVAQRLISRTLISLYQALQWIGSLGGNCRALVGQATWEVMYEQYPA